MTSSLTTGQQGFQNRNTIYLRPSRGCCWWVQIGCGGIAFGRVRFGHGRTCDAGGQFGCGSTCDVANSDADAHATRSIRRGCSCDAANFLMKRIKLTSPRSRTHKVDVSIRHFIMTPVRPRPNCFRIGHPRRKCVRVHICRVTKWSASELAASQVRLPLYRPRHKSVRVRIGCVASASASISAASQVRPRPYWPRISAVNPSRGCLRCRQNACSIDIDVHGIYPID